MSAATLASPAVSEFAAAVRAALSDLNADEVDDLTDGLEADLTDRLADGHTAELGDPIAYAEELRAAAGLPHRAAPRSGASTWQSVGAALREAPRATAAAFRDFVAGHPALRGLGAFFLAIRPLWWLFRAVVVTALIGNFLNPGWQPLSGFTIVVGIVALVLSAQFGRGKWLPFAWMRGLLLAVNVLLVIAAPFLLGGWATQINNAAYTETYANLQPDYSADGLMENGNPVTNIFAYGAQGNPLTDVQLFDQDGKPLDLSGDPTAATLEDDKPGLLIPNQNVPGRLGWNVVPLGHVALKDRNEDGSINHTATPTPAKLPFAQATPLAGSEPTPTPIPTPTPTPAP
ncbi:MAG TPA: hypothetical protein VGM70_04340 [Pseudolysinimonas sp.]|jgi:hypothetical protein